MWRRVIKWALISIGAVAACAVIAAYVAEEPLRRRIEAQLNDTIEGYSVEIEKLDLHPLAFSVDVENTTLRQEAHPEPPIAQIPTMAARVDWRALLSGRLVAYVSVEDPRFYVNLNQIELEQKDEESLKDKGWQQAIQEISPLEVNSFAVRNAALTYVDKRDFRPLQLHSINFWATDIRNVRSEEGQYPSPFHFDARVFEQGTIVLDGRADFLAEPHVAIQSSLDCRNLELDYLQPIAQKYDLSFKKGVLQTTGRIEYAPTKQNIDIATLTIDDLDAEYVHTKATSPTEEVSKKTHKVVKEKSNDPILRVDVDEIVVNRGKLGVVNISSEPHYRVFVSDAVINVKNLSNQSEDGIATAALTGQFMGAGPIKALARFRPQAKSADFDLNLQIEGAELKRMNDLLRAAGGVDVTSGVFSFYSEVSVRRGAVNGYVKPLFKDVNVYSPEQDKRKNVFRKLYEGIVDGLAWILENRPREEVATKTDISGTLSDPQASALEVLVRLIQNAFFKAILPGLERSAQVSNR